MECKKKDEGKEVRLRDKKRKRKDVTRKEVEERDMPRMEYRMNVKSKGRK